MPNRLTRSCHECPNEHCLIKQNCSEDQLVEVNAHKVVTRVGKKQIYFRENNQAFNIYFIHEGLFKVFKHGPNDKDQIVRFSRPGDILGHRGLIHKGFYPVSAESVSECVVCSFSREFFFDLLRRNAELAINLMLFFADELHDEETKLRNMAVFNVREKVAYALISLNERFGITTDGYLQFSELLSRRDISELVGLNENQLTRVLTDFKVERLLETENRRIRILNPKDLKDIIDYIN